MNDVVFRTLSKGDFSMGENIQTLSPAMDIQFAYNLERIFYFAFNLDTNLVRHIMTTVEKNGSYQFGRTELK